MPYLVVSVEHEDTKFPTLFETRVTDEQVKALRSCLRAKRGRVLAAAAGIVIGISDGPQEITSRNKVNTRYRKEFK